VSRSVRRGLCLLAGLHPAGSPWLAECPVRPDAVTARSERSRRAAWARWSGAEHPDDQTLWWRAVSRAKRLGKLEQAAAEKVRARDLAVSIQWSTSDGGVAEILPSSARPPLAQHLERCLLLRRARASRSLATRRGPLDRGQRGIGVQPPGCPHGCITSGQQERHNRARRGAARSSASSRPRRRRFAATPGGERRCGRTRHRSGVSADLLRRLRSAAGFDEAGVRAMSPNATSTASCATPRARAGCRSGSPKAGRYSAPCTVRCTECVPTIVRPCPGCLCA
jgi:hypothetical protein